jgi:hypothetical protein
MLSGEQAELLPVETLVSMLKTAPAPSPPTVLFLVGLWNQYNCPGRYRLGIRFGKVVYFKSNQMYLYSPLYISWYLKVLYRNPA